MSFIRVDKSIDPVQLVHALCLDAQANPDQKKSRWVKRMTPVTSIRKTLKVDLSEFAKEILKPHFHEGNGPKKVSRLPPMHDSWQLSTMSRANPGSNLADVGHIADISFCDSTLSVPL